MPTTAPLFSWLQRRAAGVLLHPTSLPGPGGVGTLGRHARAFVDFLAEAGIGTWQVCPLGPTGYGNSPYAALSAFAGNPYLIDLEPLAAAGWLAPADLAALADLPGDRVDFGALYERKRPLLRRAFAGFVRAGRPAGTALGDFAAFQEEHGAWLPACALFLALKDAHGGACWLDWPAPLRRFATARGTPLAASLAAEAEAHAFYQWVFFAQWRALRAHAAARRVELIGDIPLYVALDSADVWTHPGIFQLDRKTSRPKAVAGVPPDYFTRDGQLWGNPLYDWRAMARDGYAWWMARLGLNFDLCDLVRIDHFRGFDTYWAVPAGAPTAEAGQWVDGPGLAFFRAVRDHFPAARLIAEDLGDLTPSVHALRAATGLPGMVILQFAWGGPGDHGYLPHMHEANGVVYPGTHDNATSVEWYGAAPERVRDHVRRYFRISGQDIAWDFVRASYASTARLAVIAAQDLLGLGAAARFNTPGGAEGNWEWRLTPVQFDRLRRESAGYLRELGLLYGRLPTGPGRVM